MTISDSSLSISVGQLAAISNALGPVIDSVGSSRFLHELFGCVTQFADCEALHLLRQATPQDAQPRRMEWIGSYGTDLAPIQRVMQLYFGSYANRDPLNERITGAQSVELIQVSAQAIVDIDLRRSIYDVANIHDECVVVRPSHGMVYSLSACRSHRHLPFSLYELSILKHLGQILLQLAELHTRMIGVPLDDDIRNIASPDVMATYLTRRSISLSTRETSVCSEFLKGMTTMSIAEAMGVKESTVETYAKRAYAKLGVTSRRGLLSLVHGCQSSAEPA